HRVPLRPTQAHCHEHTDSTDDKDAARTYHDFPPRRPSDLNRVCIPPSNPARAMALGSRAFTVRPRVLDPRCVISRQALSGKFAFKTVRNGFGIQTTDEPIKNHPWSDVADAISYGVLGAGEHLALTQLGRK